MENKNNRFFPEEEATDREKAGRILYIVILSILVISAILVGVVAAWNRSQEKPEDSSNLPGESDSMGDPSGETDVDPVPTPTPEEDKLPTFVLPVVGMISEEHSPDLPVFNLTMNDYRTHNGIDILSTIGAPVYAVADGTVEKIWEDPMLGKCLSLRMSGDAVATYANLGDVATGLAAGSAVKSGDTLATVGESALLECGEEPHLHFEMTVGGASVDPKSHLPASDVETSLSKDEGYEG